MSSPVGVLSWRQGSLRQLPQFLVAGGTATALHWCAMAVALSFGMPALGATAIGASAGALLNFRLQRAWVFRRQRTAPGVWWRYLSAVALLWALNVVSLGLLHHVAAFPVVWAQLLTTAWVTAASFAIMKRGVFA